ncbi:SDR family NAD(P)-dependent oxidoreductase [Streptomyces sp. TLI_185]|uniref:SDR family NAD(P)-dependent oxidoreductase n=1 Tax=Streptomyces sp. TLI_185 TaxID=2485151 RepID=UPI000F508FAA|nr:glucose 1-dehydrogenase [Streptomyces sp. TLI_185]RPF33309.1 NAD(P)-dependent dehydrogenase (short-subunit alcohol dehydrogenase family) [Streptomyces sp. TLI_185]
MTTTTHTTGSRFSDRTALVTGAGSGIGRAIALAFAAEGARVVVAGRRREPLDETVRLIEDRGGKALAVTADVSAAADNQALVEAAVEAFGSLDVAVNNAGVLRGGGPLAELPEADWHTQLDINVTGTFLALRAQIRQMRSQPSGGAIVNVASNLGAHTRIPGAAAYAASKAAVAALSRGAALDHIRDGVRINVVSPGATDTPMSLRPGETEADRAERVRAALPLGRLSATGEVAAAVLYLASDDAASVVGTDLVVDSGATA